MRWRDSACCGDLERNGLLIARVHCDVAKGAYGGRVGGDNQAVLTSFDVSFLGGVGEGDMGEPRCEGNVST